MVRNGIIKTENWLEAIDVSREGDAYTIERVEIKQIGEEKKEKSVVYFSNCDRGFVLNVVNKNAIHSILKEPLTENWKGKKIKLYSTEIEMNDKKMSCIRIKFPISILNKD